MGQGDFAYVPADASAPVAVSVFADRATKRSEIERDIIAARVAVRESDSLAALLDGKLHALGEIVVVDCPVTDAQALAALTQLDMRAAQSGAQLILSTSLESLDDVFACCDLSRPQILVDPNRAQLAIALGRALAGMPERRLRELEEEDRLMLLRLTEQVAQLARQIEGLPGTGSGSADGPSAFRFNSPASGYRGEGGGAGGGLGRGGRPSLPDPRLVRRIIRQRQLRARFFDGDLFADPAWDMLLDLTAARAEHRRVSVTSLCIASGVPPTTALRWIGQMTETGLFQRTEDDADRRRAFVALTDKAAEAMARYFMEVGRLAEQPT